MRLEFVLLILCAMSCFGQDVAPNRRLNFQPVAAAGGGGGSPAIALAMRTNSASGTTTTLNLFTVSGANTLLVVGFVVGGGTSSSVSWNGSSSGWTLLARTNFFDNATFATELWYKIAPAAATASITVTHTDTDCYLCAMLITNANQSTPFGTAIMDFRNTAVNGITNTVTSVAGNLVLDVMSSSTSGDPVVFGQTLVTNTTTGWMATSASNNVAGTSTKMIWYRPGSPSDTTSYGWIGVAVQP